MDEYLKTLEISKDNAPRVGVPGVQHLEILLEEEGSYTIIFAYQRPWEFEGFETLVGADDVHQIRAIVN